MAGNQDDKDFERIKQRVEILLGERGADNRPLSALRRGEFLPLASAKMQSGQVAAAPTMAEHNALQADVKLLFDTLALLSNKFGNAKLPSI